MKSLLSLVATAAFVAALPVNSLAPADVVASRIRRTPNLSPCIAATRTHFEATMEDTLERKSSSPKNNNNNSNENHSISKASYLSPFLQEMIDEQRQLQMNVGKAMDVLRKDYPYFLKRSPDYSIYHDSITIQSSDGKIQLSKLSSYRKAFGIIRTMLSLLYDTDRSVIQSRMIYDSNRSQIRVSFNARLTPKNHYFGVASSALGFGFGDVHHHHKNRAAVHHVDGISVYSMDLSSTLTEDEYGNLTKNDGAGKIIEHRIEKLLVNGAPLQPPYFNSFVLEMLTSGGQQHGAGSLAGAGAWSFEGL